MENIYIVGVGMTHFGRHMDKSVKQLTAWAVEDALKDAGCDRKAVEAAFFGNTGQGHFDGQHMIRGQAALLPLGLQGIPVVNVENACATASTALHMAVGYLRAGMADVALAVGTTVIINAGKARYAWVTMIPLAFVSITTLTAGVLSVRDNFWPMAIGPDPSLTFQGYLNAALTVIMMVLVVVILANAVLRKRCVRAAELG